MEEKYYWVAFSHCNGIGPAKFGLLLTHFGSAEVAWNASEAELEESGIGKAFAARIIDFKKKWQQEWHAELLQKLGVDFLILSEPGYPELLKQIERPPFVLYIKGNKSLFEQKNLFAVVGTRKITDYGRQVTESLTAELAASGFVIVSGLALGVDAVAHAAALSARGKTIAVLGSGVDYCTPRENQLLYDSILENGGAIISEVPLGQMPNKGSFPARNRIIAGISLGVLVTEGAEDSGSLITAKDAFANGRQVFAVPGPITSNVSRGPIALITKGAKLVSSAKDILSEIGTKSITSTTGTTSIRGDTKEEQKIIDLLVGQNLHFDELVKKTGLDSAHVGTLVSLMEMKGTIKSLTSGVFSLIV